MVIGLVGLVMMAVPAFGSHAPPGAGHGIGSGATGSHLIGSSHAVNAPSTSSSLAASLPKEIVPADSGSHGIVRFIPSPRAVLSVLALYGAFGNALLQAIHLPFLVAALSAIVPALLVERLAVRPLWNLVFRFQGSPSAPLETLVLSEATAVTPFRNGKGIVSVVREGRLVQFAASVRIEEIALPIKVGDRLRIEDVDAKQERFVVSILRDKN
jgi:hypothetical protein